MDDFSEQAATDAINRVKAADEKSLLASEAFAFGVFEKYVEAERRDIERRIDEWFGDAEGGGGAPPG